ncbi:MAG: DUF4249 family protein [Melioribacteraceae bacterium]
MNIIKKLTLLFLSLLFIFGCEEVIELDLKTVEPKIVIEAIINNEVNASKVIISRSTDYYKPGKYQKISDAIIILTEENGNETIFNEFDSGIYFSEPIVGEPSFTYNLKVIVDSIEYNATSFMPEPIIIDSVRMRKNDVGGRGGVTSNLRLQVYFQDKEDVKDFARFKVYQNGNLVSGHNLYFDRLTNGNYINFPIFLDSNRDYLEGDVITVELQTINKVTFDYFNVLTKVLTSNTGSGPGNDPVAPANPNTNWNNNSLGYFSAYSVSVDSVLIEKKK